MYTIDHFEGKRSEWAIIKASNCQTFKLPRLILPANTWTGDVVNITVTVDEKESKKARDQFFRLVEPLEKI